MLFHSITTPHQDVKSISPPHKSGLAFVTTLKIWNMSDAKWLSSLEHCSIIGDSAST